MTPLKLAEQVRGALLAIEHLCLPETVDAVKNSAGRIASEALPAIDELIRVLGETTPSDTIFASSGELFIELGVPEGESETMERQLNAVMRRDKIRADNLSPQPDEGEL